MGAFHLRAPLSAPLRSLQHCADLSTHVTQLRVTERGSEGAAAACHSRTVGSLSQLCASKGAFLLGLALINHYGFLDFVCGKKRVARCRQLIYLPRQVVFVCWTTAIIINNVQHNNVVIRQDYVNRIILLYREHSIF